MMEMYCRHVVQARLLTTQIEEFELEWLARDDGLKRYDKLLRCANVKYGLRLHWQRDCVITRQDDC